MTDCEKLIVQLKNLEDSAYGYNINGEVMGMDCSDFEKIMADAAAAISGFLAQQEATEPLTLEELRQMDGQPVWGKSLITGKPGEWFILRVVEMSKTWFIACAGAEQGFGDKDTYGETWLAYRRKPAEELNEKS